MSKDEGGGMKDERSCGEIAANIWNSWGSWNIWNHWNISSD